MTDDERKPTVRLPAARPASAPMLARANQGMHQHQTRVHGTHIEKLDGRVEKVETVLGVPRPAPRPPPEELVRARLESDHQNEFKAAAGGMIAHTKLLEEEIRAMRGELRELRDNDKSQNQILELQNVASVQFARELGIEHRLPPQLVKSVPPPAGPVSYPPPPPSPVLGRLVHGARRTQQLGTATAIALVAEAIIRLVDWLSTVHPH